MKEVVSSILSIFSKENSLNKLKKHITTTES